MQRDLSARLKRLGVYQLRSLGQHFLIDANVLDVIGRMTPLTDRDVVYEPGPGPGQLSEFLAEQVAHVHSVELDGRMRPALEAVAAEHPNLQLHFGDALTITASALTPVPTLLVSNLPYNVAAPIVAETLQHAPAVRHLTVMVQREIADRFFAPVGASNYGALSVLVQTLCHQQATHRVSRSVFQPPPRVDSSIVSMARRPACGIEDRAGYAAFLKEAFAQRRKTLENNLAREGRDRAQVRELLAGVGLSATARAQELDADQFSTLWRALR